VKMLCAITYLPIAQRRAVGFAFVPRTYWWLECSDILVLTRISFVPRTYWSYVGFRGIWNTGQFKFRDYPLWFLTKLKENGTTK